MTLERSSDSRSFRGIKTINADAIRCENHLTTPIQNHWVD